MQKKSKIIIDNFVFYIYIYVLYSYYLNHITDKLSIIFFSISPLSPTHGPCNKPLFDKILVYLKKRRKLKAYVL
jgi:hypothetical protein